ncbi:natural killer cells antigen CD94-like [Rhinolophus sinicus]|uniref:natural killer cells antigen CD94-like n=1 Tax=Rhinolophus sinicus TaxID=89399 RepID=UPI003D7A8957
MADTQIILLRLISGILGVLCLALMATLETLKNLLLNQVIHPMSSQGCTTEPQEDSGCCSFQENWIEYRCYFVSNERRIGVQSRDFCAS